MTISLEEHVARAICAAQGFRWEDQKSFSTSASGGDDETESFLQDARAAIAAVREREGAERGRCCDNGRFGETHECQKQPAPDPAESMRAKTLDECMEIAFGEAVEGNEGRDCGFHNLTCITIAKKIAALKDNGERK